MIDAPPYVDLLMTIIITLTAFVQYVWIAKNGHGLGRWLQAIGWTGLSARMIYGMAVYGDLTVHAASIPFLIMVAGGTVLTAWTRIVDTEREVFCLQKPEMRCYREDRIKPNGK